MGRARRVTVAVIGLAVVLLMACVVAIHLPSVQDRAFSKVAAEFESATSWRLDADEARFRLMPGSIEFAGLEASAGTHTPLVIDRLEIRFRWRRLLGAPRSIDRIWVEGLHLDLVNVEFPEPKGTGSDLREPIELRTLEIDELRITDGFLSTIAGEVGVEVDGLTVEGALRNGAAKLNVDADDLRLSRDHRQISVGEISAEFGGGDTGLVLNRFTVNGDAVNVLASGDMTLGSEPSGRALIEVDADPASLMAWWDPIVSDKFSPSGRFAGSGSITYDQQQGLGIDYEHDGSRVGVAGLYIDQLVVAHHAESTRVLVRLEDHGQLEVFSVEGGGYQIDADVVGVPTAPILTLVQHPLLEKIPADLTMDGRMVVGFRFPFDPSTISANGETKFRWPDGLIEIEADGGGRNWDLKDLGVLLPGATGRAHGTLSDGSIQAAATIDVSRPQELIEFAGDWIPRIKGIAPEGGPITVQVSLAGPIDAPSISGEAEWSAPSMAGFVMDEIRATVNGSIEQFDWAVDARSGSSVMLSADGATNWRSLSTDGRWKLDGASLTDVARLTDAFPGDMSGFVESDGRFSWTRDDWGAEGLISVTDLELGAVLVDEVSGQFEIGPGMGSVTDVIMRMGDSDAHLDASLSPLDLEGQLDARMELDGLEIASLFPWAEGYGAVSAVAEFAGAIADPSVAAEFVWTPAPEKAIADPLRIQLAVDSGVADFQTREWMTATGPVYVTGTLPLGSVQRPDWLWPDAPTGPLRARLDGSNLKSGRLMKLLTQREIPAELGCDLGVDVSWDLADPTARMVDAQIDNLAIKGDHVDLVSERTIQARLSDNRIQLEPVSLIGPRGRADIGGVYEIDSGRLVGAADVELDADVLELLPIPLQADGLIRIRTAVDGPALQPSVSLIVDHKGGSIVVRDPAIELTDLRLDVEVDDGVVWIQDGEAGLNRGRLWVGGGWDPVTFQGVVLEFEKVTALVERSIVTTWSGAIAIEPDPVHTAMVVGEMALGAGLWERPFDLRSAFFGRRDLGDEDENAVGDVALDLQVAGYGGVRVDNNLGRFDANWGILEVGGTVSQPTLMGTIRLAPGGRINLPGQAITIRRATLDFTGDPVTDPVMDVVPEDFSIGMEGSIAGIGGGAGVDTGRLAAEALARGAGSVLGLENTTLQPAEVAFETQTDASSAFTAGQRLTRNVAVFLTTDLSDVQSQTTLLQLWNLRGLPGLAIQGYTRTGEAETGANLIERYSWGSPDADDDRPVIHAIRLEGDWPIGGRGLRRATGLRRGEPFDPFLLFAAGLRLETKLAENGFPRARVTGEAVGDPRLPALLFTVEAGPRQDFAFVGDRIPARIQQAVMGAYRPPPAESSSFREMRRIVLRQLMADGFPRAEVTVERRDDEIVIESARGDQLSLAGPVVVGLSDEESTILVRHAGTPLILAEMLRDRSRAGRMVARLMEFEGFPDARLEDLWMEEGEGGSSWVHLRIEPGLRRRVGLVEVVGDDPLGLTADGVAGLEEGMTLNRRAISHALTQLRSAYRAAGYSGVETSIDLTDNDGLRVSVEPGAQRRVRNLTVDGLRHITESVILKGLTIESGDVLLPAELDRSAVRTAFFAPVERADITTREVGINLTDVAIEVEEKDRWMVEAGAGWNNERGASLQFGLRDDGLLGRGMGLSLRGQVDERQRQAGVWASLPPPPGSRWSTVANFFWFRGDARDDPERLSEEKLGGAVETSYRLNGSTSIRGYGRAVRSEKDVQNPDDPLAIFYPIVTQETVIGTQVIWDRLDNPFDPRSGFSAAADLSHSAPYLGSDFEDLRLVITGVAVLSPIKEWVWLQTLRLGAAESLGDTVLSIDRRFFAGGQATIRGFDLDSVGPLSLVGGVKGGGALFVLNEEIRIPVWKSLGAAVFTDVGQVWETWGDASLDLSVGAGLGLRYATPVGPLWADIAWPVANLNVSSPGPKYYFGFGTSF